MLELNGATKFNSLFHPHAQHAYLLTLGRRRGGYGEYDSVFPSWASISYGRDVMSRRGLELREGNKTCELVLKTMQKGTNEVDKTTFPTQINAKYLI